MMMRSALIILLSLGLLQGCYKGCPCPDFCLPDDYIENCQDPDCHAELADLGTWWQQFDDPLLDMLIEKSFKCNYDVRIARERIIESRAQYQIAFSKLFPEVDLNASLTRIRNSQTIFPDQQAATIFTFFRPTYQTLYAMSFDSIWELDFFGKNYYAKQAACIDVQAAHENVRDVNVTAIGDIARNYVTTRGLQERVQLTRESIKNERDLLELTEERYKAGLVSETDVFQAKALVETREATLPFLEQSLYQTIYSLSILVGILPEELHDELCPPGCVPCAKGKIPLGLPSELLTRRGDIRRAERQWQAAGFRVASAKAELFPSFTLTTSYGYESQSLNNFLNPASRTLTLMPALNWPVFNAGKTFANIKVQSSKARQALFTYEKAIVNALSEVESALVGYCKEYERQNFLELEANSYKKASELIRVRYTSGLANFSEVLQAERLYFDAALELISSKQNLMVNLIAVYKALGGGWECCNMQ